VLALEKDYNFAEKLGEVCTGEPDLAARLRVVQGDALRVNLAELIQELRGMQTPADDAASGSDTEAATSSPSCAGLAPRRIKVVANLPYYITTDILKILLPMGDDIEHIAFMLQHEVAQRLTHPHPSAAVPPGSGYVRV
jgi:16S rRNA (adenine1518-N6/adenine1519-N6)-dimethyltransferase